MLKMVNSNNLVLQSFGLYLEKDSGDTKFKFYVGNGNNCNLIKSILKQRFWWVETNDISAAHLVWTQLKHNPTILRQECVSELALKAISSQNFVEKTP